MFETCADVRIGLKLYYSLRRDAAPGDLDKIIVTEG